MFLRIPENGIWGVRLGDRRSAERVLCQLLEATGDVEIEMRNGTAWQIAICTPHRVLGDELIRALASDDPDPKMTAYQRDMVALEMVEELGGSCGSLQPDGLHFDLTSFDFTWRMHLLAAIYRAMRREDWPSLYTRHSGPVKRRVELFVGYSTPELMPDAMQATERLLQQHLGALGLVSQQWGDGTPGWGARIDEDVAEACIRGAGGAIERDPRGKALRIRISRGRRLQRYAPFKGLRRSSPDVTIRPISYPNSLAVEWSLPRHIGRFCREEGQDLVIDLEQARVVAAAMGKGRPQPDETISLVMSVLMAKLVSACARINGLRVSKDEAYIGVTAPRIESEAMREAVAKLAAVLPGHSEIVPIKL